MISRIRGIPFENFRDQLFAPLEHVVVVTKLPWGDYAYMARHSEIAQIVFEQVLTDPADRFNECIRLLRALNPMYSVDLEAIRGLIRARSVYELFPNTSDAIAIYDAAGETIGEDAHLLQQRANYERIRPNGNLRLAISLLERARALSPDDWTLTHTLAEVIRARAETAELPLERARFRGEARSLLGTIPSHSPTAKYATVTRLKLTVDGLQDLLKDPDTSDRTLDETIRDADRLFESARQRYPGNNFVLTAEAELGRLLSDHQRSIDALYGSPERCRGTYKYGRRCAQSG